MHDDRIDLTDGQHSLAEILSWTAPSRPDFYHGICIAHRVKQFDDAQGQVPAIWREGE